MNFKVFMYFFLVAITLSCASTQKNEIRSELIPIKAFIKDVTLESIKKTDLLNENYIQFTRKGIGITEAEAYFYTGEFFENVKIQPFWNNNLKFLKMFYVVNAKTPFRMTIRGIHYINSRGKKGLAEEFSQL